jgi:hypothetical protein
MSRISSFISAGVFGSLSFALSGWAALSDEKDDLAYATSAAVLGKTAEELEARLGPTPMKKFSELSPMGEMVFTIGKCQVHYITLDQKVSLVSIKVDHDCQPSLDGVPLLEGVPFEPGTTFAEMPPDLSGTWRGNCFGEHCIGIARIDFVHFPPSNSSTPEVFLTSLIDTQEELAINLAWGESIVSPVSAYSAERDLKAICGTADQTVAGSILRDLEITLIHFGYRSSETHWTSACPTLPNAPVPISAGMPGSASPHTPSSLADTPVPPSEIAGAVHEMVYSQVRERLIASGYQPVPRPQGQFCGYSEACKLPEADSCAGAGEGECIYFFRKGKQTIRVRGIGDFEGQPQGQIVTAILYSN